MLNQGQIKTLRKRLGWNQKQMAKAIGIADPNTISHWETGFRTPMGVSERLLLLLEKLRGKSLHQVIKQLEKIGSEKSDA
ncbi:MAG: helix-turn-helix transcriptional regulator [Bdellovibrio sp.]|nr:helix-turn-helix transcriptional regulator [Bdellovibrio sp.]